jgi:hypothetical protein
MSIIPILYRPPSWYLFSDNIRYFDSLPGFGLEGRICKQMPSFHRTSIAAPNVFKYCSHEVDYNMSLRNLSLKEVPVVSDFSYLLVQFRNDDTRIIHSTISSAWASHV